MHFSTALLPLTLLVSYVSAQSSAIAVPAAPTGLSSTGCQGQNVFEACLSSTTAIANACQSTDYTCLCTSWNAVLTCYNECPNDSGYAGALSNKQTYCNNASVYTSTSSSAISRDWSTSATAEASAAEATGADTDTAAKATTAGGSRTATATGSAASATRSSGAGKKRVGGMVGALGGAGAVAAVFW